MLLVCFLSRYKERSKFGDILSQITETISNSKTRKNALHREHSPFGKDHWTAGL